MKERRKQKDLITGRRLPPAYFNGDVVDAGSITVKPYKCPVCEGSGEKRITKIYKDSDGEQVIYNTTTLCHGCDGKGWVAI